MLLSSGRLLHFVLLSHFSSVYFVELVRIIVFSYCYEVVVLFVVVAITICCHVGAVFFCVSSCYCYSSLCLV
jgi:hypothetical protein